MLSHVVVFTLKSDLNDAQKKTFKDGLDLLVSIDDALKLHYGTPAATDRPVIVKDYDYLLTCIFEDMAQHDRYQIHPNHLKFLDTCKELWSKVVIYDAD